MSSRKNHRQVACIHIIQGKTRLRLLINLSQRRGLCRRGSNCRKTIRCDEAVLVVFLGLFAQIQAECFDVSASPPLGALPHNQTEPNRSIPNQLGRSKPLQSVVRSSYGWFGFAARLIHSNLVPFNQLVLRIRHDFNRLTIVPMPVTSGGRLPFLQKSLESKYRRTSQ